MAKEKKYTFVNFKGKRQTYHLGPEEMLSSVKCPICEVYKIVWHGEIDSIIFCPSCNRHIEKTEKYNMLRETLKSSNFRNQERLKKLRKNLQLDIALLKFVEAKVLFEEVKKTK